MESSSGIGSWRTDVGQRETGAGDKDARVLGFAAADPSKKASARPQGTVGGRTGEQGLCLHWALLACWWLSGGQEVQCPALRMASVWKVAGDEPPTLILG